MLYASRLLFTLFAALAVFLSVARAMPVELQPRDVWAPKVLYPHENIVWKIGYTHHVVWDLGEEPVNITNPIGVVVLRKNGLTLSSGPGSWDDPLASGFNLTDGRVEVTVPDVTVGCGYQLVLFGDSGNFSPTFIIAAEGD